VFLAKETRKYEHSKTFGLITSASSDVVWCPDEDLSSSSARATGGGRAIVGADEEVLCWDVKKGELLSRWVDGACRAAVTAIARSDTDPDVYAVGYGRRALNFQASAHLGKQIW
jgi:U3 small nucleolar RNA-associated protein 12